MYTYEKFYFIQGVSSFVDCIMPTTWKSLMPFKGHLFHFQLVHSICCLITCIRYFKAHNMYLPLIFQVPLRRGHPILKIDLFFFVQFCIILNFPFTTCLFMLNIKLKKITIRQLKAWLMQPIETYKDNFMHIKRLHI